MAQLSSILNCFTLLAGGLFSCSVYGTESQSLVERENIELIVNGRSSYSLLQDNILHPRYDFSIKTKESLTLNGTSCCTPLVKKLSGYHLSVEANNQPSLRIQCIRDGNTYVVTTHTSSEKPLWDPSVPSEWVYDALVEKALQSGVLFQVMPTIHTGKKHVKYKVGESYFSDRSITYSRGPIDFIVPKLKFHNSLLTTPTGVYLIPPANLIDPFIKGIRIFPKIFYYTVGAELHQSRTVLLNGKINFESGEFDITCTDVDTIEVNFTASLLDGFRDAFSSLYSLNTPCLGAGENQVKEIYKTAIGHRDGKYHLPKDHLRAKKLFEQIINLCGAPYPEEYSKSLHNLGVILYHEKSYEEAAAYFQKSALMGVQASQRNIWKMQINQKIPSSLEDRFFAICDLNKYEFPFKRKQFKFNFRTQSLTNSGTLNNATGGIHAQTLHNTGLLSAPVIWVEKEDGLKDTGCIQTFLLIVGLKKR